MVQRRCSMWVPLLRLAGVQHVRLLMLYQVIEQRSGDGDSGEQEQVKERITAQLEASNEQIKVLEARLERLREGTWKRQRR
jgi:hypothetical protein